MATTTMTDVNLTHHNGGADEEFEYEEEEETESDDEVVDQAINKDNTSFNNEKEEAREREEVATTEHISNGDQELKIVEKEEQGRRRRHRKKHSRETDNKENNEEEEEIENGHQSGRHHRKHHKKTRHIERMEEVWKERSGRNEDRRSSRSKKIHVRSKDPLKIARQLEKNLMEEQRHDTKKHHNVNHKRVLAPPKQMEKVCKICGKEPYLVERIVAEGRWWHKNCFRCSVCNKILALDTYMSHEGVLYCKPHHRELFQPKVVKEDLVDSSTRSGTKKKNASSMEPIVIENEPAHLDSDIVRAESGDKYDGLENLDVSSKFNMFEKGRKEGSKSSDRYGIMEKLRRLQEGADLDELMAEMDAQLPDHDQDDLDSCNDQETHTLDKTLKSPSSASSSARRQRLAAERKAELQEMRERLMCGTREAVLEQFGDLLNASANRITKTRVDVKSDNAKRFRDLFNKGEVPVVEAANAINGGLNSSDRIILEKELELQAMRKQKRKQKEFFQKMEAGQLQQEGHKTEPKLLVGKFKNKRGSEDNLELGMESELPEMASLANRFSFFENYAPPDPKAGRKTDLTSHVEEGGEGPRDVDSARKECKARSVLSKFKEMEQKAMQGENEDQETSTPAAFDKPVLSVLGFIGRLDGAQRRPLKRFTPPRKLGSQSETDEYSDSDSYTDSEDYSDSDDYTSSSYTDSDSDSEEEVDETLRAMKAAARAKALKAKFEEWEASQDAKEHQLSVADENGACLDTASALKARFEALQMIDDLDNNKADKAFRPKRFK